MRAARAPRKEAYAHVVLVPTISPARSKQQSVPARIPRKRTTTPTPGITASYGPHTIDTAGASRSRKLGPRRSGNSFASPPQPAIRSRALPRTPTPLTTRIRAHIFDRRVTHTWNPRSLLRPSSAKAPLPASTTQPCATKYSELLRLRRKLAAIPATRKATLALTALSLHTVSLRLEA